MVSLINSLSYILLCFASLGTEACSQFNASRNYFLVSCKILPMLLASYTALALATTSPSFKYNLLSSLPLLHRLHSNVMKSTILLIPLISLVSSKQGDLYHPFLHFFINLTPHTNKRPLKNRTRRSWPLLIRSLRMQPEYRISLCCAKILTKVHGGRT